MADRVMTIKKEHNMKHKKCQVLCTRMIRTKNKVDIIPEQSERGVLSGLTSLGVVRHGSSTTAFIPKLQHGDNSKDLPLGTKGNGIKLCLGNEVRRGVGGACHSLCPGEDKVRLNNVSYEGEHLRKMEKKMRRNEVHKIWNVSNVKKYTPYPL